MHLLFFKKSCPRIYEKSDNLKLTLIQKREILFIHRFIFFPVGSKHKTKQFHNKSCKKIQSKMFQLHTSISSIWNC